MIDFDARSPKITGIMFETMGQIMILLGSTFNNNDSRTIAMNCGMSSGKLIRVSPVPTELDSVANILINAHPEDFMKAFMSKLNLDDV